MGADEEAKRIRWAVIVTVGRVVVEADTDGRHVRRLSAKGIRRRAGSVAPNNPGRHKTDMCVRLVVYHPRKPGPPRSGGATPDTSKT
jgi:hypothetical protein